MQRSQLTAYVGVVAGCFALGMFAGWSDTARRFDRYRYDVMSGARPPSQGASKSVVVAIDEATLTGKGGVRNMRRIFTGALVQLQEAAPQAVAVDVTLPDDVDPDLDSRLEAALRGTKNLVLPCQLVGTRWEDPAARFKPLAAALGHVHSETPDRVDGVSRQLSLERAASGQRRWALALEAFRTARDAQIVESPEDVEVGALRIPAPRATVDGVLERPLYIRYRRAGDIPTVSVLDIANQRDVLKGKTVFLGVTALSAANDRLVNPYQESVPGVEVHAHAYETLEAGDFLQPVSDTAVLLLCIGLAAAAGLLFGFLSGWPAYAAAAVLIAIAHWMPGLFFARGAVLPYVAPVAVAWLATAGAATYQHFFVRRQLLRSESEKSRYQQAIHWAAHEMRTPLTAIQGSSEIMARYNLPEAKQHQLSEMINSESKRLARIIQTFLDVERLAEGEMELKREPFAAADIVQACMDRVVPIAERKNISVSLDTAVDGTITGDRELMEYALYNLMTNAVKYSPAQTEVHISSERRNGELRMAVRDQGIGMDAAEQKKVFQKFYRTKRAEASGEVGTGIGLSIVDQIVKHHGGRIELTSAPGQGSCFTIVLKAS